MNRPLVTVICLCYNHERFVIDAIQSVLNQTYPSIELIVVDDASTDQSQRVIGDMIMLHPKITYIPLDENKGNCAAFNIGLRAAKGEFIVDLAADDVFLPERIDRQVRFFENHGREYGVVFTDATYIDASGSKLNQHFATLRKNGLISKIPQGDVYADLLEKYFICAPTMLVRREVFDLLGGYDESLAYEDFDFWIRSARQFKYGYIDKALTLVRRTAHSLGTKLYREGDLQAHSTYLVCEKAFRLNRTPAEQDALVIRVRYEFQQCVLTGNYKEAKLFFELLRKSNGTAPFDRLLLLAARLPLAKRLLRRLYLWWRYS
jgi:glycosyltransferase involved in cell wall biosynthesis